MGNYHGPVTHKLIEVRGSYSIANGFGIPKYLEFCAWALNEGFKVDLDEAKTTVSKYVYLHYSYDMKDKRMFKLRFSNHKPNKGKELNEDCDFFVGVTHTGVRTTEDAKKAVLAWRANTNGKAERKQEDNRGFRSGRQDHGRSHRRYR